MRQEKVERNFITVNLFSVNNEICLILSQSWPCMLEAEDLKMHSTSWFKISVEFPSRQEEEKEEKLHDKSVSFAVLLHSAQKPWCKVCFSNLSRLERGEEKCKENKYLRMKNINIKIFIELTCLPTSKIWFRSSRKKVPAIDLLSCLFPGTHYSSAVGKHLSFFSIYSCP